MPSRCLRFTIRRSMAGVALLAALLAFGIVPLLRHIERLNRKAEYRQVAGDIRGAILPFENQALKGVTPSAWARTVRETYSAAT